MEAEGSFDTSEISTTLHGVISYKTAVRTMRTSNPMSDMREVCSVFICTCTPVTQTDYFNAHSKNNMYTTCYTPLKDGRIALFITTFSYLYFL